MPVGPAFWDFGGGVGEGVTGKELSKSMDRTSMYRTLAEDLDGGLVV